MCNFNYVAFALNRIDLIGKDPSKIVKFISEVDIRIYTLVTFLISCVFSCIKYFKYQVNSSEPYLNYPISNEWQMINMIESFMRNDLNSDYRSSQFCGICDCLYYHRRFNGGGSKFESQSLI